MVSPFTNKREFHSFLLICLDHFYELFNFCPFYSLRFKLIILFFEIFSFRSCDVLFLPFNSFIFRLFFLCSPFCTFLFSILIIYYFSFCRRENRFRNLNFESNKIHYIHFKVNDISFKYSLIDRYFLYIYIYRYQLIGNKSQHKSPQNFLFFFQNVCQPHVKHNVEGKTRGGIASITLFLEIEPLIPPCSSSPPPPRN